MLPQLIIDLALILGIAAFTTLICRLLKQPVVLGYILAGYLAGNHFGLLPDVEDTKNFHTLAELGIIFLLFGLGLEFSFKKLLKVGTPAVTTAVITIGGMMFLGFETGRLLGWSTTDSVFLAALLPMASSTIIIKAFSDLGLKSQRFSTMVFGVLIVEDLFAIILMLGLTTLYTTQQVDGATMAWNIVKLPFFLVLWLGVGLYFVPMVLERAKRWLTREILLVASIGMCLGMVVLANFLGFSSALGAFVMGSIFAETVELKEIEKVTAPIKDLFGSVFFVSVGMMVNPSVLVEYWWPVVLLSLVVMVGQILFVSSGLLLSGQRLDVAVRSGFSMVQVGEFAFIIATLGVSLGVTSAFLYPVVVAVAVVTTFLTPFVIKLGPRAVQGLQRLLPEKLQVRIQSTADSSGVTLPENRSLWRIYITSYVGNIMLFALLLSGAIWMINLYLIPFVELTFEGRVGQILAAFLSLLFTSPLLWGLTVYNVKPLIFTQLWRGRSINRSVIVLLYVLRLLVALLAIVVMLDSIYSPEKSLVVGILLTTIIMLIFSRRIKRMWRHMRDQLSYNLRDKSGSSTLDKRLANMHITTVEVSPDSLFIGRTMGDLQLRQMYGVSVVSIRRGSRSIVVPLASEFFMSHDVVSVVGSDDDLKRFQKFAQESEPEIEGDEMIIRQWWVRASSTIVGRTIYDSLIREVYGCLVVGLCRVTGEEVKISPRTEFKAGDVVWLAGERSRIISLIEKYAPTKS